MPTRAPCELHQELPGRDDVAFAVCCDRVGQKLSRLELNNLTCEQVVAFLQALETQRHNHVRTRNQRLAVLRTFFEYVIHRVPEGFAKAQRIPREPSDKTIAAARNAIYGPQGG